MKLLTLMFALLGLCSLAMSAPAPTRAQQLDKLIAEFPAHPAGPVNDHTDSVVRACYFKYKGKVEALTADTISDHLATIRKMLDREIDAMDASREYEDKRSPTTKKARRLNEDFLRNRMRPYLLKLEAFQRGR